MGNFVFVWPQELKKYHKPSTARSLWQLGSTLTLYFLMVFFMYKSLAISYWLTLLLSIPTAGLAVRIYIFQHDCAHGSFFQSKKLNRYVGRLTAHLTFTPFYLWKEQHASHHRLPNNLDYRIPGGGDAWLMTTKEYEKAPLSTKISYRICRSPMILLLASVHMLILRRFNYEGFTGADPVKIRNCLLLTNFFLALNLVVVSLFIGFTHYLMLIFPVMALSGAAGCWLFFVQHQDDTVEWKRNHEWDYTEASLKGSTFFKLPKVLQWFTGNIGFHHVHHLHPLIPNYYLEKCHENHPDLKNTPPLTFFQSFRVLRNKLWDEEKHVMTGFPG